MRNYILLLLALVFASTAFAKQSPGAEGGNLFADKAAVAYFPNATLPLPITLVSVTEYLQKSIPQLLADGVELKLVTHKTSPGGEHFTFDQYYQGIKVFNSQTKVNLTKDGTVQSIFDNSYNTSNWPANLSVGAMALEGISLASGLITLTGFSESSIEETAVIAVIDNHPIAYKLLQLWHPETGAHNLYLLDKAGSIVYEHDLNSYAGGAPATGYVFMPDPITSAQTVYGAPYRDSSDANTLVLRNERVLVNFEVTFFDNQYHLKNDHFEMVDNSPPNQIVAVSATPTFLFNRSETGFEEVNAFYHLTKFQTYVDSLGFVALTEDLIQVDAHALGTDDNSRFSFGGGFPRLQFGTGGVDDAEDADVIIHEYGHALSHEGSPSTNFGTYRQAIDEGFGDYFAASYSRHLSSYRWDDVFTWDGHNEFWVGRTATTTSKHPEDLTNSIHRNGEMWATALMEIWGTLGRETADRLALQTLFYLSSNMNFTDVANAYIQADNALYGGNNFNLIHSVMDNRGFFKPVGVEGLADESAIPLALYNSWAFTHYGDPAVVKNFTNQPMNVLLMDISGRLIQTLESHPGEDLTIDGEQLPAGTYLVKATAGTAVQTFKLVK